MSRLALVGCGAVTPAGLTAASTSAAVRARISAYAESNFFHESFNDTPSQSLLNTLPPPLHRIMQARVPPLLSDEPRDPFARLAQFAALSVRECLHECRSDPATTALLLGLGEPHRENRELSSGDRDWLGAIEARLGVRFHRSSQTILSGHTSVFHALLAARQLLTERHVTTCIVAAVDSYLNVYDIERLVRTYRMLGPVVSKGLVPGEGAACVAVRLVGREPAPAGSVDVLGIGLGVEERSTTVLSDGDPTGRGLERALEAAVIDAGVPEGSIDLRISDLNGEIYRTDDSLLASTRFYRTYRKRLEIWHPAECVGDIGAASGALSVIVAWAALAGGYAPGSIAMCESSSDSGPRAGCVIGLSDVAQG